jgi:hypothetical protein
MQPKRSSKKTSDTNVEIDEADRADVSKIVSDRSTVLPSRSGIIV